MPEGGRRPRPIHAQRAVGNKEPIEAVRDEIDAHGGHDQPGRVDGLAPIEGNNAECNSAQQCDCCPQQLRLPTGRIVDVCAHGFLLHSSNVFSGLFRYYPSQRDVPISSRACTTLPLRRPIAVREMWPSCCCVHCALRPVRAVVATKHCERLRTWRAPFLGCTHCRGGQRPGAVRYVRSGSVRGLGSACEQGQPP